MSRSTVLAAILVTAFGLRLVLERGRETASASLPPAIPLSQFPRDVLGEGWECRDVELSEEVKSVAKVTDYLQRVFTDGKRTLWLYVGYVGRWNPGAIHHPGVCFANAGLELQEERAVLIPAPGVSKELWFNQARWRRTLGGEVHSLSAFYYRGKFEPFVWKMRAERALGIAYFAIITVSAEPIGTEAETRAFCEDVVRRAIPRLLPHFPP